MKLFQRIHTYIGQRQQKRQLYSLYCGCTSHRYKLHRRQHNTYIIKCLSCGRFATVIIE